MSQRVSEKSRTMTPQHLISHHPLLDTISVGIAFVAPNGVFLQANRSFCRFLGYSKRELVGKTIRDISHPDDWEQSARKIRRMVVDGTPIIPFEKRYLHKSGKTLWGEVHASWVRDKRGKPQYSIAQVVDITRRKEAEETLRLANKRFHVALAGSPATVFSQDRNLRYTWAYNLSPGFELEDFLGKRDSDIFTPADAQRFMRIKKAVLKTGAGRHDEVVTHRPEGEMIHDMTTEPLRDERGNIIGVICAAIDISERKRLENALGKANDQLEEKVRERTARLRQLTAELMRTERRERQRIADILHEQFQQNLCAMKFHVSELTAEGASPAVIGLAARLQTGLDDIIRMARTLSADLYPPVLDHLGVTESIEWLALDVKKRLGLDTQVKADKHVILASEEMRLFVFEAVRELLLNVVKHAQVKKAEVRLSSSGNSQTRIQIRDAGIGVDLQKGKQAQNHFGLFRIQERVEAFGGRFSVVSQPTKGTCVTLVLPCK